MFEVDVFDMYAPVIDCAVDRLQNGLVFGNNWEMFHWDISVAFTNATAKGETLFPSDFFPDFKGGTIARLKINMYDSKSAPKIWYNCLY